MRFPPSTFKDTRPAENLYFDNGSWYAIALQAIKFCFRGSHHPESNESNSKVLDMNHIGLYLVVGFRLRVRPGQGVIFVNTPPRNQDFT